MKKKILFVNDEMTIGGVSRILNTLMQNLNPEEYEIDLLVLHAHGDMLKEVDSRIRIIEGTPFFDTVDASLRQLIHDKAWKRVYRKIRLLLSMKSGMILGRIKKERKKILKDKHYDIEFSAKEGFCTIFVSCSEAEKRCNWIQVDYAVSNYASHHMELMKRCLKNIDVNIACSKQVAASFSTLFNVSNVQVIHNLMDVERIKNLAEESCDYPLAEGVRLIAVARFHPQKSIDRLLNALAWVKSKGIKAHCVLIGGGDLEEALRRQCSELKLDTMVDFLGYKSNPYSYIRESDLFVLSSLYEGYPTIVLESFLSGTPVLATEVAGVGEQILQPEQGWIIENSQKALNEALERLCSKPETLQNCKENLKYYVSENDTIMQKMSSILK